MNNAFKILLILINSNDVKKAYFSKYNSLKYFIFHNGIMNNKKSFFLRTFFFDSL